MLDPSKFEEVSEFYEIEKAILVVVDGRTIRIEALRHTDVDPPSRYQTRAFVERNVVLTPAYGEDGSQGSGKPEEMSVWVSHDIPWTDGASADDVLNQALSLMRLG